MGFGRYLLGVAAVVLYAGGAIVVAGVVRRRWLPLRTGVDRVVVEVPLATAAALVPALVLGSVGLLAPVPLVVAMAVAAWWCRRSIAPTPASPGPEPEAQPPLGRLEVGVLVAGIGMLAVRWVAYLLESANQGYRQPDDLHYHLTHAARFVQSGSTWGITFDSVGDAAAYHPANAELLHGVALALFGRDVLTLGLNVAFAALAVAAGWVIGRRAGNGVVGATLVSALLSVRVLAPGGGTALNDVVALALVLAAAALLVDGTEPRWRRAEVVVAGLAAGLGAGTKLTVLVPVVALAVLAARDRDRWRPADAGWFVLAAAAGGGYWYLRNLVHVGNPLPALSPGPLPGPDLELQHRVEFPLTDYVTDGRVWREYLLPGLERTFGPVWWLLVLAALAGSVAVVVRAVRDPQAVRWAVVAVVGAISLVGYAVTPTSAAGTPGAPALFTVNLRYAVPGLLLCLLASLSLPVVRRHRTAAALVALVLALSANLYVAAPTYTLAALVMVGFGAVVLLVVRRLQPRGRGWLVPAAALAGIAVLVGFVAQRELLERRWRHDFARWELYEAAQALRGTSIAVTGYPQTYPFFGTDLSNDVGMIGDRSSGDELLPVASCDAFWAGVEEAEADYVVVLGDAGLEGTSLGRAIVDDPTAWLVDAEAPPVVVTDDGGLYAVDGLTGRC